MIRVLFSFAIQTCSDTFSKRLNRINPRATCLQKFIIYCNFTVFLLQTFIITSPYFAATFQVIERRRRFLGGLCVTLLIIWLLLAAVLGGLVAYRYFHRRVGRQVILFSCILFDKWSWSEKSRNFTGF